MVLHGGRWLVASAVASIVAAGVWTPAARSAPADTAPTASFAQQLIDPATSFRPKYRWWLPLAATDDQELRDELRQIAENGGGGAEAVAFQVTHASGPDWGVGNAALQTFGWGTPLWAHKTEVMTQAARDNGIALDMTTSSYWPAATPDLDEINDPRTMQQLVFAQQYVPAGTQRSGALPANNSPALPTVSRTLCGPTAPGATNLKITNDVGGFGEGDDIVVGGERVRITAKGTPSTCTAVAAAAAAGATNLRLVAADVLLKGETITVGSETVTVTGRGTNGANGTGVTVSPPLASAHPVGEPVVQRQGTGLTVSPALANAHTFGESVVDTARSSIVAVLVAKCVSATCNTQTTGSRMLEKASVQDVTSQVVDGNLAWTAPDDGGMWNVIVMRQTSANNMAGIGGNLGMTQASGTIYAVDHLSKAGSKATTDYLDAHVLTPATKAAIAAIGRGDLFEDSLELAGNLKWTSTMIDEWKARRGYDPTKVLPALAAAGRQGTTAPFYDFADGARVRTDYRQMWSDLYIANHIDPLRAWGKQYGLQIRLQAYGDPIDSAEANAHIDTPEGESFGFGNNTERYKTVTTGAHFSGSKVTSTESHASGGNVWNSIAKGNTGPSDLFAFYRSFAGGVTQIVYHGFPYLETPPDTGATSLWPGFSFSGNTSFSEAWGPRMPQWEDYGKVNDNLGRLQMILREGKPRYDVGVYFHQFSTTAGILTSTSALHQNGFTDDYVSPAFLRDASAKFENGQLFKDQWGFKALLLNAQPTMPLDVAQKLLALARAGLPVVIVGAAPSATPGAKEGEDAGVVAAMTELAALANVRSVAALADAPAALTALGVKPATAFAAPDATAALLPVRRQTEDVDYYFFDNQTNAAVQRTLTLSGNGRPYRIDTWAGTATPIAGFASGTGSVTVPLRLAANNVAVIAVTRNPAAIGASAARGPAATATTADEAVYDTRGDLAVRDTEAGTYATTLGDGRVVNTTIGAVAPAQSLTGWSLSVDGWSQPDSNKAGENKHTAYGPMPVTAAADGTLPSWANIPALADVSGIGTYTTTLNTSSAGGYLNLGNATDTVKLTVNGREVTVDQQDINRIDLGGYLKAGENTIVVRVASTLLNAVRLGTTAGAGGRAKNTTYGLTGPVTFTPYGQAVVYSSTDTPGGVGGTVPATLSLALGTPAAFGAFTPGVDRSYDASTTATVISTAGDATLSVTDPSANATGRLVNGAFALSEPLQVKAGSGAFAPLNATLALLSYSGPVSNDVVTIGFRQHIGATQPLRTGAYSKTLTFTLSTTAP